MRPNFFHLVETKIYGKTFFVLFYLSTQKFGAETFSMVTLSTMTRVRVKQRTYFPLVSATEMAIWQAILT
jgi:hypothetical protein